MRRVREATRGSSGHGFERYALSLSNVYIHIHVMSKSSLIALQIAIENQDWESATRHCARAMALPNDMISGLFC